MRWSVVACREKEGRHNCCERKPFLCVILKCKRDAVGKGGEVNGRTTKKRLFFGDAAKMKRRRRKKKECERLSGCRGDGDYYFKGKKPQQRDAWA